MSPVIPIEPLLASAAVPSFLQNALNVTPSLNAMHLGVLAALADNLIALLKAIGLLVAGVAFLWGAVLFGSTLFHSGGRAGVQNQTGRRVEAMKIWAYAGATIVLVMLVMPLFQTFIAPHI